MGPNGGEVGSFKEFLWEHIEMALTKGFDDNVGRHPVAANFEVIVLFHSLLTRSFLLSSSFSS